MSDTTLVSAEQLTQIVEKVLLAAVLTKRIKKRLGTGLPLHCDMALQTAIY